MDEERRCSFCAELPIVEHYEGPPVVDSPLPTGEILSYDDFALCAVCAALFDADDLEGFRARVVRHLMAQPEDVGSLSAADLQLDLEAIFFAYALHRKPAGQLPGPPGKA